MRREPRDEWEENGKSGSWEHTECGEQLGEHTLEVLDNTCPGCGQPIPSWLQEMYGQPAIKEAEPVPEENPEEDYDDPRDQEGPGSYEED